MSARASNIVTNGSVVDELPIVVTSARCRPPKTRIVYNSTVNTAPLQYKRTDSIRVEGIAKLNCSGLVNTRYKIPKGSRNFHGSIMYA